MFTARDGTRTRGAVRPGIEREWAGKRHRIVHARGETLTTKATFSSAVRYERAVIPADAWTERDSASGTYRERRIEMDSTAHIAALRYPGEGRDGAVPCVIVTVEASPAMADIHHRQPLCLTFGEVGVWLDRSSKRIQIEEVISAGARRTMRWREGSVEGRHAA